MALSHRVERIAEQIREEISQMLATEVSDPGIGLVTITRVKVTGDLSLARVYWTMIGDNAERATTTKALGRAVPFMKHLLSQRLTLRRAPELQFLFDQSVIDQARVEEILQDIQAEREANPLPEPEPEPGPEPTAVAEPPADAAAPDTPKDGDSK